MEFDQKQEVDKYGLMLSSAPSQKPMGVIADPFRSIVGLGKMDDLANGGGMRYKTDTSTLMVDNVEVSGEMTTQHLVVTEELQAANVYTKAEVDQKIAEGGGGTVPDPLNINKLTASVVHANSELQALKCTITGRLISLGDVTAPNLYTKTEVDDMINGSLGSRLSVNTYKSDSDVSGEYNGLVTVGGNQNRLIMTSGRTSGCVAFGGALNNCEFKDRTENSGAMYIGGVNCKSGLTGVKQGLLVVGGQGNSPTLNSDGDALVMVGPPNGLQLNYAASGATATLMMNGKTVNVQYSQTVTHEAPFTGDASDYAIGDPVFASGRVCRWNPSETEGGEWSYSTGPMDCICELKPEGLLSEFVGVCVAFVERVRWGVCRVRWRRWQLQK